MRALLPVALLLLAGCTMPSDPGTSSSPTSGGSMMSDMPGMQVQQDTYHVTIDWTTAAMHAGDNVTFPLHVDGSMSSQTSHVGAHYWTSHQDAPAVATAAGKCVHPAGTFHVPDDFQITCTAPAAPGHYYLRGHLQEGGTTVLNWWSDEVEFDVLA